MVGAAPDRGPPACRRRGTGAHRHARGDRRARGSGRAGHPPYAGRGASSSPAQRSTVTTTPRLQLADELLRRFAATLRSAQLYSKGHPIIGRNLESLATALQLLHSLESTIVVGLVGEEVIVDDMPMAKADTMGPFVRRLQVAGVERVTIDRGVTMDELVTFVDAFTSVEQEHAVDRPTTFPTMTHIRVGRVTVGQ